MICIICKSTVTWDKLHECCSEIVVSLRVDIMNTHAYRGFEKSVNAVGGKFIVGKM